jgi:sigma-B regulation protein RsbU (phosphoserine phosphatase)
MNTPRILLVDDAPLARSIPARFLRKWGYEVFEAADGREALEILRRETIGLVISDWVMPHVSGIELCRNIRATDSDHYTYLILCTSKGEKADLIEGMEAGADDFLVKPISQEEMGVRIRAGERVLNLERGLAERNRELKETNLQLQKAYELIKGDLRAASWMQMNLLPAPSQQTLNVHSEWRFRPTRYVAGDIFNIFAVDDHRVGFYLLDVSGHGVPAAMLSVTLSMVLRPDSTNGNLVKRHNLETGRYDVLPPAEVVSNLNHYFQGKDDRYFTIIYGLVDSRTGELTLTQAGHPSPVLMQQGKDLTLLGDGGPPVGFWPNTEYETICATFRPGDRLVLYSDGVVECANREGDLFGEERLLTYLRATGAQSLPQMLEGLELGMEQWRGSAEFNDDVSLFALEFADYQQDCAAR